MNNLFRKPVELVSSISALIACGSMWFWHKTFLVTPRLGLIFTLSMLLLAFIRAYQASCIIRFQRNLRRLPSYEIEARDIPVSTQEQFLGRGFRWTAEHTQRLYWARLPQNRHLCAGDERQYFSAWLSKFIRIGGLRPVVSRLPPAGGEPALHGVEVHERDIYTDLRERVGHTLVLGTTRVGKTRYVEIQVSQDIRRGDVVIVFDPKGDVDLLLRMYTEAKRAQREDLFYVFHLGYPESSARYSPISTFSRVTEVATRVSNQLPSAGQSAVFKEFVWRFVNVMARALSALGMKPTYELVYQHAVNIDDLCIQYFEFWLNQAHPVWREKIKEPGKSLQEQARKTGRALSALQMLALIKEQGWHDPIADALSSILANDRSYFEKLVSSLYPLLEKLTTGKISELLSPQYDNPHDPRAIFDWPQVIDQGEIVYIGLDALSDFEVAAAVGNAMFADLTSTAGRMYKYGTGFGQTRSGRRRDVSLYADEFNELCGDEFIPLLNKAGGTGLRVTALTQTDADLEAKIGSRAKAQQMFGNFNTLIMLRVKNPSTAAILIEQLPTVEIWSRSTGSSTRDMDEPGEFADFSAATQDTWTAREVPMLQPADLTQLPKGQAFALIDGGQLVKLRLPLVTEEHDQASQQWVLEAVFEALRERTSGPRDAL